MSAQTVSWKTGACQASVRRRAIVLRVDVSSSSSTSPGAAGDRAVRRPAGRRRQRSTSSATIRPSGPEPLICAMSRPFSRASRRASGEALTRPSALGAAAGASAAAVAAAASWPRSRSASIAGRRRALLLRVVRSLRGVARPRRQARRRSPMATSSPSVPMNAIVLPTSTSPESTTILSRTPSASASTSCVTLSVSSS